MPRVSVPAPVPSLRPPAPASPSPLVSARESSSRVFAGDDETGQSNHAALRAAAGATADASAVRVRLRPRPAPACGGPEREAALLLASRVGRGGRQVCAVQAPTKATLSTLTCSGGADGFCKGGGRIRWGDSGRGRRWWRSGVGGGGEGGGGGISILRGLASVSSDPEPEQYLRYIHRVKPEGPPEDEEDVADIGSMAQVRLQLRLWASTSIFPVLLLCGLLHLFWRMFPTGETSGLLGGGEASCCVRAGYLIPGSC